MLIDSHAHIASESFENDVEEVLKRAKDASIDAIINISTNPEELQRGFALSSLSENKIPLLYHAGATTPHDAAALGDEHFECFATAAELKKLVAIGETGLDYFHYKETASHQKKLLRRYLALANLHTLPVIIHCREAFRDFFDILDSEKKVEGVLHCFTGNESEAHELVERGFYLSFSGIVTFKKSTELQRIAKTIPLERLLIETDSPYLAPGPYRGKKNEPAYLRETAKFIADLHGISLEEISRICSENTRKLFKI